jgi:hypothetical protein
MKDWMLANAFLLLIVLIGAGLFFVLFSLVRLLHLPLEYERYAMVAAALIDLVLTYFSVKRIHRFIDRQLYLRAQRAH